MGVLLSMYDDISTAVCQGIGRWSNKNQIFPGSFFFLPCNTNTISICQNQQNKPLYRWKWIHSISIRSFLMGILKKLIQDYWHQYFTFFHLRRRKITATLYLCFLQASNSHTSFFVCFCFSQRVYIILQTLFCDSVCSWLVHHCNKHITEHVSTTKAFPHTSTSSQRPRLAHGASTGESTIQ